MLNQAHSRRYTQDGLPWSGGFIFLNLPMVAQIMIAPLWDAGQLTI